jgi:penicillin-binding protein 1A
MRVKKIFRWLRRLALAGIVLSVVAFGIAYITIVPNLPAVDELRNVQLEVPLRIYTEDGRIIGVFGERRRIPVTLEEVPAQLAEAFIAGEDARFYEHPGVDYQGITRAVFHLVTTGDKSVGGSTITQMLARNFFLSFEKTYTRKIKEMFLALKIEKELSKPEILELFLNKIFLGHRAYGVGAAAQVYYGKTLAELSLAQCAMIAALPKAPSRINPINQPERALARRNYVLTRMFELNYIDETDYQQAIEERDLAIYHGPTVDVDAPYIAELVRAEVVGRLGNQAYSGGYEVVTTINSTLQQAASKAVRDGLYQYDRRHGYRGAEANVDLAQYPTPEDWNRALQLYQSLAGLQPGLVLESEDELAVVYLRDGQSVFLELEQVKWARKFISRDELDRHPERVSDVLSPGDIIRVRLNDDGIWTLSQLPGAEAALVSIDPENGALKALVGGFDFNRSKFNRATQSRRQPGSNFKPFVYSAALEHGYTTATLVNDAPIVFHDSQLERTWKPENFSEKFYGPTRLREAMVNSRNLVSVRLLEEIGVSYARSYITQFGFDKEELPPDLSMALGSASLTPLSMARGYSVFANTGYRVEPFIIRKISDSRDNPVFTANPTYVCRDCPDYSVAAQPANVTNNAAAPRVLKLSLEADEPGEKVHTEDEFVGPPVPNVAPRVISEQNAFLVRSMMEDVIRRGTGRSALQLGRSDLAGKTGTTNEQRDAWFSGYNSNLVTTVWVGHDNHESLGRNEVGGRVALPIWIEYMRVALDGIPESLPQLPDGIAQVRINAATGNLAEPGSNSSMLEVFRLEHVPEAAETTTQSPSGEIEEDPYDVY